MKRIPLTQGKFAIVDDRDYAALSVHKWYARWNKTTKSFYAVRNTPRVGGSQRQLRMHRVILGLDFGDKRQGDHAQRNTLDNRRTVRGRPNLRIASASQNAYNTIKHTNNTSGHKGVSRGYKAKWRVTITINGVNTYLGEYSSKKKARSIYNAAAKKYHGEFARTN